MNHQKFTHTDSKSTLTEKVASYSFTKSSSPFHPVTTGVLYGSTMGFMDPKLMN